MYTLWLNYSLTNYYNYHFHRYYLAELTFGGLTISEIVKTQSLRNSYSSGVFGFERSLSTFHFQGKLIAGCTLQIGCQVAVFMFLINVAGKSFPVVVVANVVLGLSMSSITPTTITMTEHFMDMTSKLSPLYRPFVKDSPLEARLKQCMLYTT